jgi:uncharacterized hydrophobic protein (TIGR00271 family)
LEKNNPSDNGGSQVKGSVSVRGFRLGFSLLLKSVWSILNITDNAQPEDTIKGIERDIDFRGFNVWILILAIFIASIGLNVNSTAVIIGAMLISPLMGPIMGLGLSVGISDWSMLKRSLRSLAIAVSVSLLTSSLYFAITPLSDAQSELLARTSPNLLDVFIAFFGGLAGILAGSRKEKNNVVPGVAIATALMPPLCTAGYGIGTGQWHFAIGAFYLFLINSIFISISTFMVVRLLRFPAKEIADVKKQKRLRGYISLFAVLTMVPAGWVFYNTVSESLFNRRVDAFVNEIVSYDGTEIVKKYLTQSDSLTVLNLVMLGERVPDEIANEWRSKIKLYELGNTKLRIVQSGAEDLEEEGTASKLLDFYTKAQQDMLTKEQKISLLEAEIQILKGRQLDFNKLSREVEINYPELITFNFAYNLHTDFISTDTIPFLLLEWNPETTKKTQLIRQEALTAWMKEKLNLDTVVVLPWKGRTN